MMMAQSPSPSQAASVTGTRGRRPRPLAGGRASRGPALCSGFKLESAVTVTRHSGCGAAPALTQARKPPPARDRRGRRGGPVPLPQARGSLIPAVAQRHSAAQAGGRHS